MDLKRIAPALLAVLLGAAPWAWGGAPEDGLQNEAGSPKEAGLPNEMAEYPEWARQGGRCHYLMTDAECDAMRQTLAATPDAAERARKLAENRKLLREREASCSCTHERRSREEVALLRQIRRER